jgi:methylmalonyl-CoA/ethylmalonyl-CoA epimerase
MRRKLLKVKPISITHVAVAVSDLEKAIEDYTKVFDFDEIERLDVTSEGVKVAMLKIGNSEIELLSPMSEKGSIAKFLKEKGEGIHHIALRVPDVQRAIDVSKAAGLQALDDSPRSAARGAQAGFIHPKSLHGVLLEFYNR